jgi:hypothetical protein
VQLGRPALVIALGAVIVAGASGAGGVDPPIGYGPALPGLKDAQNEPSIAVDAGAVARGVPLAKQPLAAGANDYFDEAVCGVTTACSFFPGVGISGVYFSLVGGLPNVVPLGAPQSWTEQGKLGYKGYAIPPAPYPGKIATVPRFDKRLASHGDPALAFGPRPTSQVAGGESRFAWKSGSRLYYATLAQQFKTPDRGPQTVAVSRTDDVPAAARGLAAGTSAWMAPVVVSDQLPREIFADKPAIWADNAAASPHFGSVYLCWASYNSVADAEKFGGSPNPILFSRSVDGGTNWSKPSPLPAGAAGDALHQGCAIRTDSLGTVYVVWEGSSGPSAPTNSIYMAQSSDGGANFRSPETPVATVYEVGEPDPLHPEQRTFDGIAGARTNSWPSIDIANGAPSGAIGNKPPPNTIVLGWADARLGLNKEQALVQYSTDGGASWSKPQNAAASAPPAPYQLERPDFPAVAISPNGQMLYVVYTAFYDSWKRDLNDKRPMGGVMRATTFADFVAQAPNAWRLAVRGDIGDARGTANAKGEERGATTSLVVEFIGDYNSVVATDQAGYAVWVDVADTQECPAVTRYRSAPLIRPRPNILKQCSKAFGNTNVHGAVIPAKR